MKDLNPKHILFIFLLLFYSCNDIDNRIVLDMPAVPNYKILVNLDTIGKVNRALDSKDYVMYSTKDTLSKIYHSVHWGTGSLDFWYSPKTYIYSLEYLKKILPGCYDAVYEEFNGRKFKTILYEEKMIGIIHESNFYSDTINLHVVTWYRRQFNIDSINSNKHYDILKSIDIVRK